MAATKHTPSNMEIEALMQVRRWECQSLRRYYVAWLERDLFGDLVIRRVWGGIGSRRGGKLDGLVTDELSAARKMRSIERLRERHGYRLVN